ncbi:MAG: hypothetical protein I8N66_36840, partial [Ensifer sp. SSB1]|nr:hypothetical protein [Ensifer sp. SSB1]
MSSSEPLPTGDVEIEVDYQQQPFKPLVETNGGVADLRVNGKSVAKGNIDNVVGVRFSAT